MTPVRISNHFRFMVGQLPETKEVEPKSDKAKFQQLNAPFPMLIDGQIMPGDREYYLFSARAGQKLVFQREARRLLPYLVDAVPGWNDVCPTLYDTDGREIISVDDFRFDPDAVLICDVPKDGDCILEARDIIFRGRGGFVYRLSIGELAYTAHIYPLGGRRNATTKAELFGVHLRTRFLDATIPSYSPSRRHVDVTHQAVVSNSLPFAVGDAPEEEKDPNDSFSEATRLEVLVTVTASSSPQANVVSKLMITGALLAPGRQPVYCIAPAVPVKVQPSLPESKEKRSDEK
mgnify:CR=1 FL=1